jgi:hypothetical protein
MLVECSPSVLSLGQFKLNVCGGLAKVDLKVVILEPLRDLVEDKEALMSDFAVLILQEVNDVLGDTHVEASLDLVGGTSLEDGSHNS